MSRKAAIITSFIDTTFDMKKEAEHMDIIVCTDGGYDIALANEIRPDLLLGDFDSVSADLPADIPVIRFNPIKDYTDLHLAIDKVLEMGASDIEIWGGIGGRLDHTMANIQLLSHFSAKCDRIVLKDGSNEATVLHSGKTHIIKAREGWYLSLFSMSDECRALSIKGTAYQVEDFTLSRTWPIGVSNEFASENAAITMDSGTLLLILSKM